MSETGPQRCPHGIEISLGCGVCVAGHRAAVDEATARAMPYLLADRHALFARVIAKLVGPIRFSGPVPTPDFGAYASRALECGFDPGWAADWIRTGYPEPPRWIRPDSNRSPAELDCTHPRQMTPQQDLLPCAWPKCLANRGALHRWVTVVMKPLVRFSDAPAVTPAIGPGDYINWERVEYRDERDQRLFFWRPLPW